MSFDSRFDSDADAWLCTLALNGPRPATLKSYEPPRNSWRGRSDLPPTQAMTAVTLARKRVLGYLRLLVARSAAR